MNHLDLVVPGLCGPLPDINGIHASSELSALIKMLARANREKSTEQGFYQEISVLFDFDSLQVLPSAALTLMGSNQACDDGVWFHADPVHLQADMDHALLRDSSSIDVTPAESEFLINEFNQHFFEDGMQLISTDKDHWFLKSNKFNNIKTSALHDVIGCNVNFHLPQGEDEIFWKRFLNEVQMLFHNSDVNQRREASGQLAINSLWLWGGGELPEVENKINRHVYTNHKLVKGLSNLCGSTFSPLTEVESIFKAIDNENTPPIVVVDDVFIPACYGDINVWQKMLAQVFEQKIKPLVSYVLSQKMSVRLRPCNGVNYLISSNNKFRILRKNNIGEHILTHG